MRRGALWAAAAAVPVALLAHALDVAGQLPFVHETEDVRTAMGPAATLGWLALTALLVGAAAATRPATVGLPATLLTAGLPELIGRHDPGAVFEPGAMLGALVQWLLLLTVMAVLVIAERVLRLPRRPDVAAPVRGPAAIGGPRRARATDLVRLLRCRAPPAVLSC